MGLTRSYKTTVFYIYICSFSTKFILQMRIIAQAYLRCCGVTTRSSAVADKPARRAALRQTAKF